MDGFAEFLTLFGMTLGAAAVFVGIGLTVRHRQNAAIARLSTQERRRRKGR